MAGRRLRTRTPSISKTVLIKEETLDDLTSMKLETFEDYKEYNNKARTLGIPVKCPPTILHKHVKCKVTRLDGQERNAIRIRKRSAIIDYDSTVLPGKEVEMPECIIDFLHELVYPQYKEVTHKDGTSETVFSHDLPRFAVQVLSRG